MSKFKIQNPNKVQNPKSKIKVRLWALGFGFCLTFGLWILILPVTSIAIRRLDVLIIHSVYAQVSGGDIEQHLGGGWPFHNLGQLMSSGIQTTLIASGILVLAFITYGGINYLIASGDKEATIKAQKTITNAIIGMVIVVAAFAITKLIETVFGIRILSGITLPRP